MNYANPQHLPLISASIMLLVIFYLWVMRRRSVLTKRFADKNLLKEIAPTMSRPRKIIKALLIVIAFLLCLLAFARPQWGFEWEEVKMSGLDMLIAIDVSKSMLAKDVKPNRLERSKFAVKDLVKKLNGDRVGLIAFAGTAFLQCPLTIDYNGFLLTLDDLSTSTIPRGGTSISSAIIEACNVFRGPEKKYKVLIIITDGEDLEGDPIRAAEEAVRLGVKIYCVGVGTQEGDLIPIIDETGQRSYVMDRAGTAVKTRLNEKQLKEIAMSSGGAYIKATQGEFGLALLYDRIISKLEKRDIESKMRKHYEERFPLFLAIAILLLFVEPIISERKRVP